MALRELPARDVDEMGSKPATAAVRLVVARAQLDQAGGGMSGFRYLLTDDVAERYGMTKGWVDEQSRLGRLPHRILPGTRRRLYLESELQAYDDGAELETLRLANGGRHVRPKAETRKKVRA